MNRRLLTPIGHRRGAVIVAIIATMLLITLIVVGMVLTGAREQDLTARRMETIRAFYAAESGANMAIREMILGVDSDADGAIGTISNDGNDANDPTVSGGQVKVTKSVAGPTTTLSSVGRSGAARRKIDATLQ